MVRYADDFVIGFENESDARECLDALKERLEKFGLQLHPDKSRLIEFGRTASARRERAGQGPCETFEFLGFTHICGKTRRTNGLPFGGVPVAKGLPERCRRSRRSFASVVTIPLVKPGVGWRA